MHSTTMENCDYSIRRSDLGRVEGVNNGMANIKQGEGVPDFVLLDEISENAVFNNMKKRYQIDQIYTYIGDVVVAVNPYKALDICSPKHIDSYRGRYMYEMPPHIYALSNDVYGSMLRSQEDQCVIISGESGAGKTESSKILMRYVAAVSKSSREVDRVKNQLLDSNPILEAFGNAKTLRNDNSSRFGKYMEIQFEKDGAPVGGKISNYLLEKSRVVTRAPGERSFHIFYNLLAGGSNELGALQLKSDPTAYDYLRSSECVKVDSINDVKDFQEVLKGLNSLGFGNNEKNTMWKIISAILHLGNVKFKDDATARTGQTKVEAANPQEVDVVAKLLQVDARALKNALVSRSISTGVGKRGSVISVPLDQGQALFTRDALAKSIYEKLFNWLIGFINSRLENKTSSEKLVIGVLDIYGFEIFENNSFEQFCINLCNEKLQQLFIELTLKSEQEEYVKEGIKWEPIKYFNNKIICDLIEGKPMGVISLLDEACLIAECTDMTFLDKINTNFVKHPHFDSYKKSQNKMIPGDGFMLKHYAGDVTYRVPGFLEKNKDTLYLDLINSMRTSPDKIILDLFPAPDINSKKRPLTAATQFKIALAQLMDKLLACQPHYIRCVKPNEQKKPGAIDEERVRHQIRYLGLVENVRVRRAGFAYRQTYERFLWRYKMTAPATWPQFSGSPKDGTQALLKAHNINSEEYRLGKTKVFIRNPTTLFHYEDVRAKEMPRVVTCMQAAWRGFINRAKWSQRKAAIKIQLYYRRYRFRNYFVQLRQVFANVKQDKNWGKNFQWPSHPRILSNGVKYLHMVHANWRAKMMITSLSKEEQAHMRQKVLAYDLFKGKKPWAVPRRFDADYLGKNSNPHKEAYIVGMQTLFSTYGDTEVNFADYVTKVNPVGKSQKRGIVVTEKNIYKHDPKNYKVKKFGTPLVSVRCIWLSSKKDTFCVVQVDPSSGARDMVIDLGDEMGTSNEKYSEFVTVLVNEIKKLTGRTVDVKFSDRYDIFKLKIRLNILFLTNFV
eukprot:TRINITY_DN1423_c0_g1_i1.p1 TRINITY_DN1423_c0_g1~~TRINITY_DN1423_c0_g1_i1.p1  ORF type:complete len:1011 (-),score=356.36 TRINITY_DN1423_c0_g1_i1:277-3309(-)